MCKNGHLAFARKKERVFISFWSLVTYITYFSPFRIQARGFLYYGKSHSLPGHSLLYVPIRFSGAYI